MWLVVAHPIALYALFFVVIELYLLPHGDVENHLLMIDTHPTVTFQVVRQRVPM